MEEKRERESRQVDTGGGAYIGGNVEVKGGDFVGRDKVVKGDEVKGDKIEIGDVSGEAVLAVGRGARVDVQQGDTYSGDFRGAILNVRSTLKDVHQSIGNLPHATDDTKAELERLIADLEKALETGTRDHPDKAEDAEAVAQLTESLVGTAAAEKPNRSMIEITGEGLKQAAKNISDVMPTVLDIATKIVAAVGAFAT